MTKKKTTAKTTPQKEKESPPMTPIIKEPVIIVTTPPIIAPVALTAEPSIIDADPIPPQVEEPLEEKEKSDSLYVAPRKIETPLQDNIRHFFYEHILGCIDQVDPKHRKVVLDIGSRDSKWPAFLAREGHPVFCIDRWDQIVHIQQSIMANWKVQFTIAHQDVTGMDLSQQFHFILDIFAIQHNGSTDHDIASWLHCANMLGKGGFFTTVVKYNHTQGSIQEDRSDGAMRTYSHKDVQSRIVMPLKSALPDLEGIIVEPILFDFQQQSIGFVNEPEQANALWLVMQRQ